MFSGIIETIGIIQSAHTQADCLNLKIIPQQSWEDLNLGDSISVNGVCLTITHLEKEAFQVSVVPETLRVSNLGTLSSGQRVNLERSMKIQSRLHGHFVQGHVDQTGEIIDLQTDGKEALLATIRISPKLAKYLVNKGYIAIDGMSITVIQADSTCFTVTFIPYTQQVTLVNQYKIGTLVNLEVDMLGKYIEKLLEARQT